MTTRWWPAHETSLCHGTCCPKESLIPAEKEASQHFCIWSRILYMGLVVDESSACGWAKTYMKIAISTLFNGVKTFWLELSSPQIQISAVVEFFAVFHLCVMARPNYIMLFPLTLKVSETQEQGLERYSYRFGVLWIYCG